MMIKQLSICSDLPRSYSLERGKSSQVLGPVQFSFYYILISTSKEFTVPVRDFMLPRIDLSSMTRTMSLCGPMNRTQLKSTWRPYDATALSPIEYDCGASQ